MLLAVKDAITILTDVTVFPGPARLTLTDVIPDKITTADGITTWSAATLIRI